MFEFQCFHLMFGYNFHRNKTLSRWIEDHNHAISIIFNFSLSTDAQKITATNTNFQCPNDKSGQYADAVQCDKYYEVIYFQDHQARIGETYSFHWKINNFWTFDFFFIGDSVTMVLLLKNCAPMDLYSMKPSD